ncbi:hypothetical protein DER46DRAFT_507734 [Fusarium sp. MPI-SDFR-AT-0072]|nr:hypothetical protein DER46DRAFT_507734 [Fusarium sp. MPI-SDFR-AT-0072]
MDSPSKKKASGCITSIGCNRGYAVVIRIPLNNYLIKNAKIHQAVTAESPPFLGPCSRSDYVA